MSKDFLISFFLPEGMTDWFEVVKVEEKTNEGKTQADVLFRNVLHISLDDRDDSAESVPCVAVYVVPS